MNIRTYNKDHLKEHAGVTLATPVRIAPPQSDDPLIYWTHHEEGSCEVNLQPFATGQATTNHKKGGGKKFKPFSGRPDLIRQLAPAIEEALSYSVQGTVLTYLNSLRNWWRILDAVEAVAATAGQPMKRVEDVRHITQVHSQFARDSGMNRHVFGAFRTLVDTTRMALGMRQTYWESIEDQKSEKHTPPQEQRNALRFAVRHNCRNVLERWAQSDRLSQRDTEPDDPKEAAVWRDVKYMRIIQKKTDKILPKPGDLKDVISPWARNTRGNFKLSLLKSVFPSHRDADAVWHQCLLNTGWNPSTLTTLDVAKKFLFDHFKDDRNDSHKRFVLSPQVYELVGKKGRAGDMEQIITGQWKTLDGPGHLIESYLKRVEPLRNVLKQQLEYEKIKYKQAKDADYKVRTAHFERIKNLEQGVRSVWLYVNRQGNAGWITDRLNMSGFVNGKPVTYLDEVVHLLNTQLASANARQRETRKDLLQPVPHVVPKDFRVWFADYVYRASHGNMLHVKKALNHRRLSTSNGYTHTKSVVPTMVSSLTAMVSVWMCLPTPKLVRACTSRPTLASSWVACSGPIWGLLINNRHRLIWNGAPFPPAMSLSRNDCNTRIICRLWRGGSTPAMFRMSTAWRWMATRCIRA